MRWSSTAQGDKSRGDEKSEEELGEWFESLGEGESIPAKTAVPEAEEGEVTSEIPEISTEAMGEPEVEEKLESSEHADIYRMKKGDQVDIPVW